MWALVWGAVAASIAQVIVLWFSTEWRPTWTYDLPTLARLYRFSFWVMLEGGLGWFYAYADWALLGKFLGLHELGVYKIGATVTATIFGLLTAPVMPVIYSALCLLATDRPAFVQAASRGGRLFSALLLPLVAVIFILGDPLADAAFGPKWSGLGVVISYLAVVQGMTWFLSGINTEAFRAIGRPDVYPKLMAACLLYYLPTYYWAAPMGLMFFLKVRLGINFVTVPVHVWLSSRIMGVPRAFYWNQSRTVWLGIVPMLLVVPLVQEGIRFFADGRVGSALEVVMAGGIGAATFVASMAYVDRPLIQSAWSLCRNAFTARGRDSSTLRPDTVG